LLRKCGFAARRWRRNSELERLPIPEEPAFLSKWHLLWETASRKNARHPQRALGRTAQLGRARWRVEAPIAG
jgi:hypothetical protein